MGRLAWSQLRFRSVRLIALLAGMLLATTAFTVLTAASHTAQLRTTGTVSAHFVPAYDILVRPKGARTAQESQSGTVQPNFLSGIYGGITVAQYQQIARVPGVSVAAPIAMVGYTLMKIEIPVLLPASDNTGPGRELFRYSTTWVSEGGSSRISQPSSYLYLTPDRLGLSSTDQSSYEVLPGGSHVTVCPQQTASGGDPFGPAAQSSAWCWSKVNGTAGAFISNEPAHRAFASVDWSIPMLIAAVDPAAEARLDGLDRAVTSGRYLTQVTRPTSSGSGQARFPVLAAATSGVGEYAETQVERLTSPSSPVTLSLARMSADASAPGSRVLTVRTTAQQAYAALLHAIQGNDEPIRAIWTAGPTRYTRGTEGALTPQRVSNPPSVWQPSQATSSLLAAPMDNTDYQYRVLKAEPPAGGSEPEAQLIGLFDPVRVKSFDPLSEVPLGAYQPTAALPANAISRVAVGASGLLPSQNLGGYISQPVDLITSLSALPALEDSGYGQLSAGAPISAIRVRVAGVTGPNPLSLERIRAAAQQIAVRTHLVVDIVTGSSPQPTTISLPAGKYGQPALTLTENWVKKGVAVTILTAVDKNSLALFALILVVCVLFVANSASAAIRSRRRELGVLACLGWTRPRMFTAVLSELAAIGLTAGILGGAAALPLAAALGLHASPARAALAVPVAVGVAVVAGAVPAWLAASADPVTSVRPPVLGVRRARHPDSITALAASNVLRTPGRSLVGALSLAIGITALTTLTSVTFAFRGVVVGSLLGDAVAVQVRGVDYVATFATVALGVLAVADVVFLNIRERGAELATIRALGWSESSLSRLVVTEGALIGLSGAVLGAGLGLAATAKFTGQLPAALFLVTGIAVVTGSGITALSALLPAQALRRLPATRLLAEE